MSFIPIAIQSPYHASTILPWILVGRNCILVYYNSHRGCTWPICSAARDFLPTITDMLRLFPIGDMVKCDQLLILPSSFMLCGLDQVKQLLNENVKFSSGCANGAQLARFKFLVLQCPCVEIPPNETFLGTLGPRPTKLYRKYAFNFLRSEFRAHATSYYCDMCNMCSMCTFEFRSFYQDFGFLTFKLHQNLIFF